MLIGEFSPSLLVGVQGEGLVPDAFGMIDDVMRD